MAQGKAGGRGYRNAPNRGRGGKPVPGFGRQMGSLQPGASATGGLKKKPGQVGDFSFGQTRGAGRRKPLRGPTGPRSPQYTKAQSPKQMQRRGGGAGQRVPPMNTAGQTGVPRSIIGKLF